MPYGVVSVGHHSTDSSNLETVTAFISNNNSYCVRRVNGLKGSTLLMYELDVIISTSHMMLRKLSNFPGVTRNWDLNFR